ncbi:hypothetical protein [Amycolatopsis pithecellobii]|uniref:Uncharacterized protein n=1 Tax=Amycolatopsis pithecellobii TaxID=664692 RepID=A0A6N7ZBA8_9PSEU|nr:hypothetical protein [Amycolatopsis pithecellobii]MTD59051.1 hypothetical protein [Amycolatopsis pithecellobii]
MSLVIGKLESAPDLRSVRQVAAQVLAQPSTRVRLAVALRVSELLCAAIDELLTRHPDDGAALDTGIYRPCRTTPHTGTALSELLRVSDGAEAYLLELGAFDDYADVIAGLVEVSAFRQETDDLVLHRCLLAVHAAAEVFLRAGQGKLTPTEHASAVEPARYPKGDVKHAVVRTALRPVLGHHQIMTLNCAACVDAEMPPRVAFTSYQENLCWFTDWATAHRDDGDIMAAIQTSLTGDSLGGTQDLGQWGQWRARNGIGDGFSRWLAQLDHLTKKVSNPALLHTGVLCAMTPLVRKVIVASVSYGSYHFWPVHRQMSFDDYVRHICASIGGMVRGWAVDHDSEAAIGEHNLLNWVCRACATAATRDALSPRNAQAKRDDARMRIAWGPQTYFYFGQRHHGFARRVDNLREQDRFAGRELDIRPIPRHCSPVVAGDNVPDIVSKLLALCGADAGKIDEDALGIDTWDCTPRLCAECAFDGQRAQLFMISVGAARLACLLPRHYRAEFVRLMDTYGFRLFPAVQTRLLVQCACLPRWIADVLSHGYADAGTWCGQSDCTTPARQPLPPDIGETDEYDHVPLPDTLLRQAQTEARRYAADTGRTDWLAVVARPLKI